MLILFRKSDLDKSKFEKDYMNHSKYKQNILKIRKREIPASYGRPVQLPPIDSLSSKHETGSDSI